MRSMGRFDECERRRGTTRGVILFKTFVTLFKTFATLFKTFVTFKTFANAAPSRALLHLDKSEFVKWTRLLKHGDDDGARVELLVARFAQHLDIYAL